MDPFSHAIVGGTVAASFQKNGDKIRVAVAAGILAGMAPDLDVLIRAVDNPMLQLGYHRHFTHALLFAPFGAFIVALFMKYVLRIKAPLMQVYWPCLAGFAAHGPLDSMTNYGTHLFWPLTERRESWSIISIIDPIFTFTLLGLLVAACVKKARRFALIGAAFGALYLGFGYAQKMEATAAMEAQAQMRGHVIARAEVKPALANLFVWRGQYESGGQIYTDAYHVSPWRGRVVYAGGSLPLYTGPLPSSETQLKDFEYFKFFSDGWLIEAPAHPGLVGDARFAVLPNALEPLWGIRFQPALPDAHVLFESPRTRGPDDFKILWAMIKGEPLAQP